MDGLRRWLEKSWYGAAASPLLRPLGILFGWVVRARRWAYRRGIFRSAHPGVPVIVVGNIGVGGTGKTPLVLWLVHQLQAEGLRAGVVTRGHGARHPPRVPRLVSAADSPDRVGDEALLLARRAECPVCVGVDRLAAARELVSEGCQVIVADDGLQHYALQRNLEIAVIDGERGLGNAVLLPAGPLREPPLRLREVDVLVLNGPLARPLPASVAVAEKCLSMRLQPRQFVRVATGEGTSCPAWRGRAVHAVAGIGNPGRFFATLRGLGLDIVEHAFADHHRFSPGDLDFGDERDIVMTEKDAVKCAGFASGRMWYLSVAIQFENDDAARLMALVRARLAAIQGN